MFIYDFQVRDDFTNKASKQQTLYSCTFTTVTVKLVLISHRKSVNKMQRLRRVVHKVYG